MRVHALLDETPHVQWPMRGLLVAALVVPLAVAAAHGGIHHGLETLIGALS